MPADGFKEFEECARGLAARLASEGKPSLDFVMRSAEEVVWARMREESRRFARAAKDHPVLAEHFRSSIEEFDREETGPRAEWGMG